MANQELYDYLTQNFGKVTVLDNGYYYAQDSHRNEIYINPNATTDVNLLVYYPGKGNAGNSANGLRNQMKSSNPPDYCAVISFDTNDPYRMLDKATTILNDNNYNVSGLITTSHSRSGGMGIERTADYLRRHPELCSSTIMISNDGYNVDTQCGKDLQILIDNNVPIYLVSPSDTMSHS